MGDPHSSSKQPALVKRAGQWVLHSKAERLAAASATITIGSSAFYFHYVCVGYWPACLVVLLGAFSNRRTPFPQPLAEWLKTLLLSVTVIPTGTKTWSSADKVLLNSESLLSRSVRMTTEFFRHPTTSLPLTLRTRTGVVLGFLHPPVISLYMFACCCYWGRCPNNYCGNALVSLACCLLFAYNKQTHFIVVD